MMASYMSKHAYSYARFQRTGRRVPCYSAYSLPGMGVIRTGDLAGGPSCHAA